MNFYKFNPYKANVLCEGSDVTIVSNGDVLAEAYKASEILAQKGVNLWARGILP